MKAQPHSRSKSRTTNRSAAQTATRQHESTRTSGSHQTRRIPNPAYATFASTFQQVVDLAKNLDRVRKEYEEQHKIHDALIAAMRAAMQPRAAAESSSLDLSQALAEERSRVKMLTEEMAIAEQRERQHLSQVLHDTVQQLLVGAKLRLDMLQRGQSAAVREGCEQAKALIQEALHCSRSLTGDLGAPALSAGLRPGLEWLANWMEEQHQLKVVRTFSADLVPRLSEGTEVLLFHAARELLFNVVKHADVRTASVAVGTRKGMLEIIVADAGKGFDTRRLQDGAHTMGLAHIAGRLQAIGGRMSIESTLGRGCRVTITVPVEQDARGGDKGIG